MIQDQITQIRTRIDKINNELLNIDHDTDQAVNLVGEREQLQAHLDGLYSSLES